MTETIRFPVAGMTCVSCVNRITRSLRKVDGVRRVRVDLRSETATVERDPSTASDVMLAAAVSAAGYASDVSSAVVVTDAAPDRRGLNRFLARWYQ